MPPLTPPTNGIADGTTFAKTPAGFAPPGSMVNVVPFDTQSGRPQLGKRPGLSKAFQTRLGREGNRRIQCLRKVARAAAVDTFTLGAATPLGFSNAVSRNSGLVNLNVGLVDTATRCLREALVVDWSGSQPRAGRNGAPAVQNLTPSTGTPGATPTPSWCDLSPDGTLAVVAFNFSVASQNRCLLVFVDAGRGDVVGSKLIIPTSEDVASPNNVAIPANAHCWTARALWVARGTQLWYVPTPVWSGRARLYDPLTTTAVLASPDPAFDLAIAASKITGLATHTDSSGVRILACFEGATGAGTFANPLGSIVAGSLAKHYRSGVFRLTETAESTAYAYWARVETNFGGATATNQPYAETTDALGTSAISHNSIRFSRVLGRAPRGCLPTGIACAPDGSFAVCFTNQGFGPTTAFLPNGAATYTTVAKFDASGRMLWESDTQSVIGGEQGGYTATMATQYACDIPDDAGGANPGTTSKDGPSIRAIDMTADGLVVCGGRVNAGLFSVFCLGSAGGQLVWRTRLDSNRPQTVPYTAVTAGQSGKGVPAGGLSLDTGDRSVLAVGARNNTWQSTAFAAATTERDFASLWKLSPVDGEIEWGIDACQDATTVDPKCCAAGDAVVIYGQAAFQDT